MSSYCGEALIERDLHARRVPNRQRLTATPSNACNWGVSAVPARASASGPPRDRAPQGPRPGRAAARPSARPPPPAPAENRSPQTAQLTLPNGHIYVPPDRRFSNPAKGDGLEGIMFAILIPGRHDPARGQQAPPSARSWARAGAKQAEIRYRSCDKMSPRRHDVAFAGLAMGCIQCLGEESPTP